MWFARSYREIEKYFLGSVRRRRGHKESRFADRFVSVVFGIGITLVFTFLLLTVAMVLLQGLDQWRR